MQSTKSSQSKQSGSAQTKAQSSMSNSQPKAQSSMSSAQAMSQNSTQQSSSFCDKEILNDALMGQKLISANYNVYAGECVSEPLKNAFLNILDDEHRIQSGIFRDMQSRGWYEVEAAEATKIKDTRAKLTAAQAS
jgi:spore coat protein CotF